MAWLFAIAAYVLSAVLFYRGAMRSAVSIEESPRPFLRLVEGGLARDDAAESGRPRAA